MKILILARGIPSDEFPQEGCFEWDQACALKSIGHEPIVISLDARFRKSHHKWGITKLYKDGIETYKIYGGTITIIEHLLSYTLAQWIYTYLTIKLLRYVLKIHTDIKVIHAHYIWPISRIVKITDEYSIPIVGTEHLSDIVKDPIPHQIYELGKKSYYLLDKLITVSPYLRDAILKSFNVNSIVCGNVLGSEFIETPLKTRQTNNYFTFVSCGNLIDRKGYDVLIKAFSLLNGENRLIIIGDGPNRKKLKSLIEEKNLQEKVELVGKKNKDEIIEIFDKSDCFVLSSLKETFGVVLIEAFSRGLPVISTKCGGADEIVRDNMGVYVPAKDPEAMASAMQNMINTVDQYNPSIIRNLTLDSYAPVSIASKLDSIYKSVIKDYK